MIAKRLQYDGTQMRIVDGELGKPCGAQALVLSEYSNVSIGTELAFILRSAETGEPAPPLGYSVVGTIDQAGPRTSVAVGQRVLAVAPHASAVVVDDYPAALTPVPVGLPSRVAALGTLVSVALHAGQRGRVRLGETALLFGHGLVGALLGQLLKLGGVSWLGVVEPNPVRRELARRLSADAVFDPGEGDLCGALRHAGQAEGVDVAFETAGHASPSIFPSIFDALRIGGRLVCTSTFLEPLDAPLYPAIVDKELTLTGAHQPKCPATRESCYPHSQAANRAWGLRLLAEGRLQADELITHVVPWDEAPGFYSQLACDSSVLGAVIDWRGQNGNDSD